MNMEANMLRVYEDREGLLNAIEALKRLDPKLYLGADGPFGEPVRVRDIIDSLEDIRDNGWYKDLAYDWD